MKVEEYVKLFDTGAVGVHHGEQTTGPTYHTWIQKQIVTKNQKWNL